MFGDCVVLQQSRMGRECTVYCNLPSQQQTRNHYEVVDKGFEILTRKQGVVWKI